MASSHNVDVFCTLGLEGKANLRKLSSVHCPAHFFLRHLIILAKGAA
jgi:hypothetical protein